MSSLTQVNDSQCSELLSTNQDVLNKIRHKSNGIIPGDIAIWILIFAELFEFGLFFIIFIIAKAHNPDIFSEGALQLDTMSGILNTVILLTSSFFIAKAVRAIKKGGVKTAQKWIVCTFLAGATYCGVKAWEYHVNELRGIGIETDIFFTIYYYLTFNHLLHVMFGMFGLLWVLLRSCFNAYSKEKHAGLEAAACYWHMVDLAWIIIFPLLYVLA
jgi:cytochrome c oxidase subunit 3